MLICLIFDLNNIILFDPLNIRDCFQSLDNILMFLYLEGLVIIERLQKRRIYFPMTDSIEIQIPIDNLRKRHSSISSSNIRSSIWLNIL